MTIEVHKFGGACLSTPEGIKNAIEKLKAIENTRIVATISAPYRVLSAVARGRVKTR